MGTPVCNGGSVLGEQTQTVDLGRRATQQREAKTRGAENPWRGTHLSNCEEKGQIEAQRVVARNKRRPESSVGESGGCASARRNKNRRELEFLHLGSGEKRGIFLSVTFPALCEKVCPSCLCSLPRIERVLAGAGI